MTDEPATDTGGGLAASGPATVRLRLDVAYDGTDFAGWAPQTGLRTVAGVLGGALSTVFREPVALAAAGRTDSGVHADGQVAHIDVTAAALRHVQPQRHVRPRIAPRDPRQGAPDGGEFDPLVRRLGRFLPADVRVLRVRRVPPTFDARFSALRRHYRYRLSTAPFGVLPAQTRFVTGWPRPLDVAAMREASASLLGLHDFAAFCRRRDGATTIRELQRFDWEVGAGGAGGTAVVAHVAADAFCWSMVRSLVGAVLAVGEHRRDVAWCAGLLEAAARSSDVTAAPARGLTLVGVDYPSDDALAARAGITRDRRALETPRVEDR